MVKTPKRHKFAIISKFIDTTLPLGQKQKMGNWNRVGAKAVPLNNAECLSNDNHRAASCDKFTRLNHEA
jgi:hypothetical protein